MSKHIEPVHLVEDAATGDRFLIYSTEGGARVEIRYDGDVLWMTQAQMADLFGRDVSVISRHVSNILAEGELPEEGNLQKVQIASGKPVTLYSLDMVISVGYRVSSTQGTIFRKWATEKLVQFATKGFVVDTQRLKDPELYDRITELRDIIRDIRSDEKNVYRELRRICKMCQDYDGESKAWRDFYQKMQAKIMFAVTSHTPSEIMYHRANSAIDNMGLKTWGKTEITKADCAVAKNYLAEGEISELNRLTTILLDIFDDQLKIGKLVLMADAERLLNQQLKQLNRSVLRHGGSISRTDAERRVHEQYALFNSKRKAIRHAEADVAIAELKKQGKALPKTRAPAKPKERKGAD